MILVAEDTPVFALDEPLPQVDDLLFELFRLEQLVRERDEFEVEEG